MTFALTSTGFAGGGVRHAAQRRTGQGVSDALIETVSDSEALTLINAAGRSVRRREIGRRRRVRTT